MKNSAILRTAKVGGFNKDDVLTYVDELNAKIDSLKGELEKSKTAQSELGELDNYKNEVKELKEKLAEAENKLTEARANADAEISNLQNMKNVLSEENNDLKNEIEALKYQLEAAQSAAEQNVMTENTVDTFPMESVDTSGYEREIDQLKSELADAENRISEMTGETVRLKREIQDKSGNIERLMRENEDLRMKSDDSGFSSTFDMGALFSEAQTTAKKVVLEAKSAADKLVRDAQAESEMILRDARTKADRINAEAVGKAAIMEDEARKNTRSAVTSAEKLKQMFRTESYILDKKLTDLMKKIESISGSFISDIEAVRTDITENIDGFISEKSELNEASAKAASALETIPEKLSSSYMNMSPNKDSLKPEMESISQKSIVESDDDINDGYSMPEIYSQEHDADDDDDTPLSDSYSMPYISMSDDVQEESIPADNDNVLSDDISLNKEKDSQLDDILSSFSIKPPLEDDDDEPAPTPKATASLGFDLGDLAKLAEEAEKGL